MDSLIDSLKQKPASHLCLGCWYPDINRPEWSIFTTGAEYHEQKAIIFDKPAIAKEHIQSQLVGTDRDIIWYDDKDGGYIGYVFPMKPNGINKVGIIANYDPFDLPYDFPIQQETHLKGFRYHINSWNAFWPTEEEARDIAKKVDLDSMKPTSGLQV